MAQLREIISEQNNISEKLSQLFSNIKKDSSSRKTLAYIQKRQELAKTMWCNFEKNHQLLSQNEQIDGGHAYFADDLYDVTAKQYNKVIDLLANTPPAPDNIQPSTSAVEYPPAAIQGSSSNMPAPTPRRLTQMSIHMQSIRRFLNNIFNDQNTQHTSAYYSVMKSSLDSHWLKVQQIHMDILNDDSYSNYDPSEFINLEDEIIPILIEFQHKSNNNVTSNGNGTISTPSVMQLPKMSIPVFNGDYLKWKQFEELFSEVIGKQNISNTQKMMYLKANLTGEPSRLIHHLQITDVNYASAWQILCTRYENTRLIVTNLLDKLLLQQTNNLESASSIKALHDTTQDCLSALSNIGMPVDHWNPLLHYLLVKKLDPVTHALYEQSVTSPREVQKLTDLLKFLELRFQALESLGHKAKTFSSSKKTSLVTNTSSTIKNACIMCKLDHPLFSCNKFLELNASERFEKVKSSHRCINCLKEGHGRKTCTSRKCLKCNKAHNTLLHFEPKPAVQPSVAPNTLSVISNSKDYIFLGTAIISIIDKHGNKIKCRCVLDSGSQLNFLTERMFNKLGLSHQKEKMQILGIGHSSLSSQKRSSIQLQSTTNNFHTNLEVFVLQNIASEQPTQHINIEDWPIPKNIVLADPNFNIPSKIDLLIGAELFCSLLAVGQIQLNETLPTLQNTLFGWVVLGKFSKFPLQEAFCGVSTYIENSLDLQLQKFWELEDHQVQITPMTTAERICEDNFLATTTRDGIGRYTVRLPFIENPLTLGQSTQSALRRFHSLESKLLKNPSLRQQYTAFMEEYIQLNHMEEIDKNVIGKNHYIIPHHCVLRPESSSTKLRVVFDASAKTSNNTALNEILATGGVIQDDLFAIINRFRLHRYVFSSDIAKMYRQILVHKDDRKWQIILWRNDPKEDVKYYQLRTVTYGTTSAPYLATRCLQQLAVDEAELHPLAAKIAKKDFYVDDVMTGSDDLFEAMKMQSQLIHMLKKGGFELHKWCSNHPQLLKYIPTEKQEIQVDLNSASPAQTKTLGIIWLPESDHFIIKSKPPIESRITKRTVLSDTAQIFDPLGFVNPVIVLAKIFLQELWSLQLDWDAALPMDLHTKWIQFRDGLIKLNNIQIPRHMVLTSAKQIQLHAFSDASEKAYGTVIYLRSINEDGEIKVSLACAKSRVAPKKITTLPRLELCAATLMVTLVDRLKGSLGITIENTTYWTDSQIVLSWLQATSSSYKTFVANRVSEIQRLSKFEDWKYINTKLNPADLVSRGVIPEELSKCDLWFKGPPFLQKEQHKWPQSYIQPTRLEAEERIPKTVLTTLEKPAHFLDSINHKNSFRFLKNVVAYVLRFTHNCRAKNIDKLTSHITIHELRASNIVIIKYIQSTAFENDIKSLKSDQQINKSNINNLTPFLDKNEIIRVGGRLQAAHGLTYNMKHQILLPSANEISRLIAVELHEINLHAGPQALLAILRQQYWPLHGKQLTNSIVKKCILCIRSRPQLMNQIMGNLPADRINVSIPFTNVGIDFAGPIQIHYKLRGKRPTKSYICVFVCFATKAVHLELASDLTTAAFIACLKRFIARRGRPSKIHCDNATNFVGARNQLAELTQLIASEENRGQIINYCSHNEIEWKFIPARSPHFGGLWEAAVKSAKMHLVKILHSCTLTYEELNTIVTEIEAILNSRPLTSMSNNPNDLEVLTAGHFLIGQPLTSINESPVTKHDLSQTWTRVKALKHEFWRRWSREYLCELQYRNKWTRETANLAQGSLVLMKEDNVPPLKWQMGRVINTQIGPDGRIRVVELKTANGFTKRAVHNVCPLPIESTQLTNESTSQTTQTTPTQQQKVTATAAEVLTRNRRRAVKRVNPVSVSSLLMCCLFCISFCNNIKAETSYKINIFKQIPSLYFEEIGRVSLTNDKWDIIVYMQLTEYWKEGYECHKLINKLNDECSRTSKQPINKAYCEVTMEHFFHQMQLLDQDNLLLRENNKARNTRRKRELVNGVGIIANELFGTLDSRFAKHYEDQILAFKNNENHLLNLLRNQTSILESTKNVLKKDEDLTFRQFELLNSKIEDLQRKTNNDAFQEFTLIALHTLLIITGYRETQNTLLEVLTQTQLGRFHPLIITMQQLETQLNLIRSQIPHNLMIPGDDAGITISNIHSLLKTSAAISNDKLIFKITVPLLNREYLQLFKLFSLPIQHNGSLQILNSHSEYLAVNLKRDHYYFLHGSEFIKCQHFVQNHCICTQSRPMFNIDGKITPHCEMELFLQATSHPQHCLFTSISSRQMWIQLTKPNQYIFYLDRSYDINIICDNTVSKQLINGTGIIELNPQCTLKSENLEVTAHNNYANSLSSPQLPSNYLNPGQLIHTDDISVNHQKPAFNIYQQNGMIQLENQIQTQKDNEYLPATMTSHDIHHYSVIYGMLGIIMISGIFWYIRMRNSDQSSLSYPTPAPRSIIELTQFNAGQNVEP